MKRIGVCTYTDRPPKGTSRKRRQKDARTFKTIARMLNFQYQRLKPSMDQAYMDMLVFGEGVFKVSWDGDRAEIRVDSPPTIGQVIGDQVEIFERYDRVPVDL